VGSLLIEPDSLSGESLPVPGLWPWDCLAGARPVTAGTPIVLWESPSGESFAGIGALCRIDAEGPGRFGEIRRRLGSVLGRARHRGPAPEGFPGAVAIGGFSFDEQGPRRGWPGFPDGSFYLPRRIFWRAPGTETVETRWSADAGGNAEWAEPEAGRVEEEGPGWDRAAWVSAVRSTLERIRDGALSKAVLARSLVIPLDRALDGIAILTSLREAYPTCYRFLIDDGRGNAFLGASPERLARLAGGEIRTEAVAGTERCGPGEDAARLARALLHRLKDRSEHTIVLQHLLEVLAPMCETLEAPETPDVMRLPHLLHLRTAVRGRARAGAHVLDLVSRLHPTPAVAGWPRHEALAWIRQVEGGERGWYAGPVGWVNAAGEGDFAVGIRSVAIRARAARLFAGAGIVGGSDPELEWSETELKMKGILDAIARD
jgi:isochorismate synthase